MTEETLFHQALEVPAADRAAFLTQKCGDDHGLRRRVEALLHAADNPGDFLGGPPLPATTAEEKPCPEGPGTVIGRYKLLQQIGEGGMGTVFMAEQQEPVRRMVALKVIKPGMDSRQVIARFEAERQALALMDHPNIAKVLDANMTVSGRPYFVMELVKGVPLTRYCDEQRLTPRQRLELLVPVCQAVQHAHQKGIIHRDIKPSNVLVALYDGKPVPKVIDFGLAKATGAKLTDKTLFTGFGAVVGTLEYMSPEQAEVNQLDVDTRADVYALGVLLYELLTGTTPLDRKRLREAALLECLRLIREEEPPKPSTRLSSTEQLPSIAARRGLEPKKLSRVVTGDLDWIVMKCLEKKRNRRYDTANGLALDLQRYLADEPVSAGPPTAVYRLRKFMRRHKAGVVITMVVVVGLLLAGGGVSWVLLGKAAQRTTTATAVSLALTKATAAEERANQMPFVTNQEATAALVEWRAAAAAVAEAEAALTTGAATNDLRQQVAEARQRVESHTLRVQRKEKLFRELDEARLARSVWVVNHFDNAGGAAKYVAAFAAYDLEVKPDRLDELARRIRAEEPEVRDALLVALDDWTHAAKSAKSDVSANDLRTLAQAADDNGWRKRLRTAAADNDRASLLDLSAEARHTALPAANLVLLAISLDSQGERAEALSLLRWGRGRHPTDFWMHLELGLCLRVENGEGSPVEVEEALGCYRTAVALRPLSSVAHNNLGTILAAQEQWDEAIAEYKKALEFAPKNAHAHSNLGNALRAKQQWDEAFAEYHEAIKLDPRLPAAYINLGGALAAKERWDEAIAEYKKALDLLPTAGKIHSNLGLALAGKQQWDEAIVEYRKAIEFDPKLAYPHNNLGLALVAKQQLDEAIAEYKKALNLDPKFAQAHNNLGNAFSDKQRWDEAIAEYHKALDLDPKWAATHFNLGLALAAKEQWDEAIAEYKKALDLDPKLPHIHDRLAVALAAKRQWDEAIAEYRKAIALDPKRPQIHNNLGLALAAKQQLDDAIVEYEKAVDLDPKYATAHFNLGAALYDKQQIDEAIAEFRKAIEFDPKHVDAHNRLGTALGAKGKLDEAIVELRKVIELDPKVAQGHYNLGNALAYKQQWDEAIAEFKKAVELAPKYAAAHTNLGIALATKQQLDEAIAEFRQAIVLDPKLAYAHFNLGGALIQKGRFTEAKTSTQQALELLPENHPLRAGALRQLQQCKTLLALETKLPDVLAGKMTPADNVERLGLIEICRVQQRQAFAAKLYADAFAADAKLADDLKAAQRYNAACSSALAAAGKGIDADKLDDKERNRLRQQALEWLRADLNLWSKRLETGKPQERSALRTTLKCWQKDSDLATARDAEALRNLPADEQESWRKLWADVAELLKQTEDAR